MTTKMTPVPVNEPVRAYAPGDAARASIKKRLESMRNERPEISCVIYGKEIRTGNTRKISLPHDHRTHVGSFHLAGPQELQLAIEAAERAKPAWEALSWKERAAIFLKASDLLAGSFRDELNASTMLGQSKNIFQAEIDAACELIDFFRFNVAFYEQILNEQPLSPSGMWNTMEYRPLEGFVAAITPFNFTSIAANLCAAPALLGNTVVWKPSDTQMLSAYHTVRLFEAAGLPPGVINLVPAEGPIAGETLLSDPRLAGVHFTGSTNTFRWICKKTGENIAKYRSFPRLVGETGGKDFVFAHPSAELESLKVALVRGAFEYQGQKCSAASRAYIPKSIWSKLKEPLIEEIRALKIGDVLDFRNFVNAVIDARAFERISDAISFAKSSPDSEVLVGGDCNSEQGYFISPTLIHARDPLFRTMQEELFGPVLTVYVYDDSKLSETLELCDRTSPYALTGAVFAQDREAIVEISARLRHSAGNFYINDKPTGAVVGQQPFGGARASGTNDKAGSPWNLLRWTSPRTIKENFQPPRSVPYPFQSEA
jgi:1-pyrroline-5-carboxylate dehydrogenase